MKIVKPFFLFLFLGLVINSCKQDPTSATTSNSIYNINETLSALYSTYQSETNPQNASKLVLEIMKQIGDGTIPAADRLKFMEGGNDIAAANKLSSRQIGFLYPLIKEDKNSPKNEKRLADLANIMFDMNKTEAANVLSKGFIRSYPSSNLANGLKEKLTYKEDNIDAYIMKLGEEIFTNPDATGLNREASTKYIDACQAHALAYPNSASSPEYLYKSAEVAKSIRSIQKALSLYDWILEEYPNYEKTPTSLFIKGFIIENELKNNDMAESVYKDFLAKYPSHDLNDDVQFLLDNLGKSDEEIAKIIEAKQKK